jgi:hypothetical protein
VDNGASTLIWKPTFLSSHGTPIRSAIWKAFRVTHGGHQVQVWPPWKTI